MISSGLCSSALGLSNIDKLSFSAGFLLLVVPGNPRLPSSQFRNLLPNISSRILRAEVCRLAQPGHKQSFRIPTRTINLTKGSWGLSLTRPRPWHERAKPPPPQPLEGCSPTADVVGSSSLFPWSFPILVDAGSISNC